MQKSYNKQINLIAGVLPVYDGEYCEGIYADVFTWLAAMKNHVGIPREGIYRHAEALARRYNPAVLLSEDEEVYLPHLEKLEKYLGKKIAIFSSAQALIKADCVVWFSIAVDSPSPLLPELTGKVLRVTVLHDTMASRGIFGANNVHTFNFGAQHNDVFLPVSDYTENEFKTWCNKELYINPHCKWYSGFHAYSKEVLDYTYSTPLFLHMLGIGTIYPRKNTFINAMYSLYCCGSVYWHVGLMRDEARYSDLASRIASDHISFFGYQPDEVVSRLLQQAAGYVNLSSDEGFSLCPLEAILMKKGVVVLSDIPVHREIYNESYATFVPMEVIQEAKSLGEITPEAEAIFANMSPPQSPGAREVSKCQRYYYSQYHVNRVFELMEKEVFNML